MRELQPDVWHWEAPHPDWKPGEDWGEMVSSYAIDDGDRLLLFDPLAPPSEIEEVAAGRETAIVLTCPWHRRDAQSLAERLGALLYVPPPDEGDPNPVEGEVFREAERLPAGVGDGLEVPADWVGAQFEQIREGLRPLLELPVEHGLAPHGGPTDRAALERALLKPGYRRG